MSPLAVINRGGAGNASGSSQFLQQARKEAMANWIAERFEGKEADTYFLTLTCKQAKLGSAGGYVHLNREILSNAAEWYFRRIDSAVFKNAARRFEKAVERACSIEGGRWPDKHLHLHALVVAPPLSYIERAKFADLVKDIWKQSPWGDEQIYFEPLKTDLSRASAYLVKDGADALDEINCRFSGT